MVVWVAALVGGRMVSRVFVVEVDAVWGVRGGVVLEVAVFVELVVCGAFFGRDEAKEVAYTSGRDGGMGRSEIDYILVGKRDRSVIRDVAVVGGPYPETGADKVGCVAACLLCCGMAGANSVMRTGVGSN